MVCVPPPTEPLVSAICNEAQPTFSTDGAFGYTNCLEPTPENWLSQGQPDACIVAFTHVESCSIGGDLVRVVGHRPLVLVATDSLETGGLLVDSENGLRAPGANPAACAAGKSLAGGGAGGSFMTKGGSGGDGAVGAGNLGAPAVVGAPTRLRGGCPGDGADDVRGNGGGAIYLLAGNTIRINGPINVSGAGGAGGDVGGGGGAGGGAGGMIVLVAPTVIVSDGSAQRSGGSPLLYAAGGGGGAGGLASGAGSPGGDVIPSGFPNFGPGYGGGNYCTPPCTPENGKGGAGSSGSGDGAPGGAGTSSGGGGGGGGGIGYIRVNSPNGPPAASAAWTPIDYVP